MQRTDGGAGIAVAAFDAIGQQNDIRWLAVGNEVTRRLLNRGGEGRAALGLGLGEEAFDDGCIQLTRR